MRVAVPEQCLVVLIGASGAGKTSFARRHFRPSEILSSDHCRLLVADDENDQSATPAAFEVLHHIAGKRLAAGRLTVVDATNLEVDARRELLDLARVHHLPPVAIVLDVPSAVCEARNAGREDRRLPVEVLRGHVEAVQEVSVEQLVEEGFRQVTVLHGVDEVEAATVERLPPVTDRRDEHGPFDIVGDVHGCLEELVELLAKMGYEVSEERATARHPDGRRVVLLGDLVDRGPDTPGVLRLAMGMVRDGTALCVPGNHESTLVRALRGGVDESAASRGLALSLGQLAGCPDGFADEVVTFVEGMASHLVLDGGRLVVAHAGLPEEMHNRDSEEVRRFALHGETGAGVDGFGRPARDAWAGRYQGQATVVYGHTPVRNLAWVNNTICVDTGCVYGGSLTALRYPERELVSLPATRIHYGATQPPAPGVEPEEGPAAGREPDGDGTGLDVSDIVRERTVRTASGYVVTMSREGAARALEGVGRSIVDPAWLVYLPPVAPPGPPSRRAGLLEHPEEVFAAFADRGVDGVVCEYLHWGGRATAVVCRNAGVARSRFGVASATGGAVYTAGGVPFFPDEEWDDSVLDTLRAALAGAGVWEELGTDWVALDLEVLPWNVTGASARHAAVGAAGQVMLERQRALLEAAGARGAGVAELSDRTRRRARMVEELVAARSNFCWPVDGPGALRLVPLSVLAAEGEVCLLRSRLWHLDVAERLHGASPHAVLSARYKQVRVRDVQSRAEGIAWWQDLTAAGGAGMAVRPVEARVGGGVELAEPALVCRGPGHLRLVFGPEYSVPENLARLRERDVTGARQLALRQHVLGVEGLERLVAGEPVARVHECAFGVLVLGAEGEVGSAPPAPSLRSTGGG